MRTRCALNSQIKLINDVISTDQKSQTHFLVQVKTTKAPFWDKQKLSKCTFGTSKNYQNALLGQAKTIKLPFWDKQKLSNCVPTAIKAMNLQVVDETTIPYIRRVRQSPTYTASAAAAACCCLINTINMFMCSRGPLHIILQYYTALYSIIQHKLFKCHNTALY